ncbi:MAG: serine/threonine protein kinase, partial [Lacipirellulaceae bacterium]
MNPSTTILQGTRTITFDGDESNRCPSDLLERYEKLLDHQNMSWTEHLRFRRLLGTGGQGVVYLSDRRGCDGFTLPVALKLFSPERFVSQQNYDDAMGRIGEVSCRVAQI